MGLSKEWTDSGIRKRPSGWRKGQGNAPAMAEAQREIARGGEHDLEQVKLPDELIKRIIGNIGKWRTEYNPEYAPLVATWLSNVSHCWTLRLIAAALGCSERTLYHWIAQHEDFAQAIAYGKAIQEAHFGSILLQGFKYSRSVEYVLANLHDWTAKREDTHKIIDLNREIAEREEFAQSHRVRKKVDWREGKVIDATPQKPKDAPAQIPAPSAPAPTPEIIEAKIADSMA